MHTVLKLAGAALLAASATFAIAHQNTIPRSEPEAGKATPLPSQQPPAPGENQGVGSRPMGPAKDFSTSNKEMEEKGITPKRLEEQGKLGGK